MNLKQVLLSQPNLLQYCPTEFVAIWPPHATRWFLTLLLPCWAISQQIGLDIVTIDRPPRRVSCNHGGYPATTEGGLWINRATPVTRMLQVDWVKRGNIVIQGYALGDGCRILNKPATESLGGCSIEWYRNKILWFHNLFLISITSKFDYEIFISKIFHKSKNSFKPFEM